MQPSALQLERSFFRRIDITAQLDAGAVPPQTIEAGVTSGRAADNPLRYQVTLVVRLPDTVGKTNGYRGEVEIIGQFSIAESVPEPERDRTVAVVGSSLLYGMVREMIANLTARGPWPMVVLPTVTFNDLVIKKDEGSPSLPVAQDRSK